MKHSSHHRSKFGLLLNVVIVSLLLVTAMITACAPASPGTTTAGMVTTSGSASNSSTTTTGSQGSLSKQQAIQLLLDKIVKPSSLDHEVIAFTLDAPLPAGTTISPYAPDPLPAGVSSLPDLVPETLSASAWFFWVDDAPQALFSHPTRFVLVDAVSGSVKSTNQGWWPIVNGQEVIQWTDMKKRWDTNNWAFSNIPASERPAISSIEGGTLELVSLLEPVAPKPGTLDRDIVAGDEGIVVVNAWGPGHGADAGFTGDVNHVTEFGTNAQIPVQRPQGDTLADVNNAVARAVNAGAKDIVFYWVGHGGRTADGKSYLSFKGTPVYAEDLTNILKNYPKVKFKVLIHACYSGGLASTLMAAGNVDIFLSSANANESAWGYADGGGSTYFNPFWQDMENILNSPDLQQHARDLAAGRFPEMVGWLMAAGEYARNHDEYTLNGKEHPVGNVSTTPDVPTTTQTTTTSTTTLTTTSTTTSTTPPAPASFTLSFQDNGSYSTVVLKVTNMQPGWTVTGNCSGPGVSSPNPQTATYLGGQTQTNGTVTVSWKVTIIGTYSVNVTVTDASGNNVGTFSNSEYVT